MQRRNATQQQQQQPLEVDGEATATRLVVSPSQQRRQQQHGSTIEHETASSDGRSTPTLDASDTPLIAHSASLSADTGIVLQPPLQQEVAAVGAGTHLSKSNFGSWLLFYFHFMIYYSNFPQ